MSDHFALEKIREQFPILKRTINDHQLVYFDNAATTQKPQSVIDAVVNVYENSNANLNRGSHTLAQEAHQIFVNLKDSLHHFFTANVNSFDVAITKNTTESVNIVAHSFFHDAIVNNTKEQNKASIILVSSQEHHSNLLPWIQLQNDFGFTVMYIPLTKDGALDMNAYSELIKHNGSNIKLVAIAHASNVIGSINDVEQTIKVAHEQSIPVLIDCAQTVGHIKINLDDLQADFIAGSAHKMYGPSGIGFLFIRKELLKSMSAFMLGGGMVSDVNFDSFEYLPGADRFLAGTQNLEAMAGFSAALTFMTNLGMDNIAEHEQELTKYLLEKLSTIPEVTVIGPQNEPSKLGLVSFTTPVHPHDLSDFLDKNGIAVRAGAHCAHTLHKLLNISSSLRVSFGVYNTIQEIDYFIETLKQGIAFYSR